MRVCFLIYNMSFGGAERTVAYLSNYGANNGFAVDVAIIGGQNIYNLDKKINLINLGDNLNTQKRHKTIIGKVFGVLNSTIKVKKNLKKYIRENNPDVIFCMSSTVVKYIPRNCGSKIIGTERSNPAWIKTRKKIQQREKAYNRCDAFVFQTKRAQEYYEKHISVPIQIVIPNAIGNELCYKVDNENKILQKKISAIGTLRAQKDYPTMLEAFAKVLDKHKDYSLEIFGDGVDKQMLQNKAKELNIAENVRFMGDDLEAIKKISNSACYVMSSISEGMPNALMEAMAIGLPCVSTDCNNGPAELIENEKNGLLVPVQNPEALAEAICKMIEDRKFALACGKEASKIKETNSIEEISKRYFEFIGRVVNGN